MFLKSIRFKLIVGGILAALIPTAIGYVAITDSTKAVSQLSETNEQFIAEGIAMQVEATLEGEMKFTASFATRAQVRNTAESVNAKGVAGAAEALKLVRQDIKKRFELLNTNYVGFFITDAAGLPFAEAMETGESLQPWDIPQHPCFIEAKTTRKVASGEIVRSRFTGEPVMMICAPIFTENGAFLGVVGSLLKASVLTDMIVKRKIGETGYCFMINQAGIIIAHPDEKNILKLNLLKIPAMEKMAQAMVDGKAGAESYVFKGIRKVAGFTPVKGKSWSVAAAQNAEEFFAGILSLRNSITLIVLFSVMATCAVIFMAATSLTRPLNIVIQGLEDIARGKGQAALSRRIKVTSNDEIGILSEKFNHLMESLHGIAVFKKVIEEEDNLEDIYLCMGNLFTQKLGIPHCFIFQVANEKKTMTLVYPEQDGAASILCDPEILDRCELCKANRLGHIVSSTHFPAVCRQFTGPSGTSHHCHPIVLSGAAVAVVMFVFNSAPINDDQIFKAEEYINESLAVIETKRLMRSLRDTALIDEQTGIHNRRYLHEYSEKIVAGVLRRGKSIGLIMCDLDFFKRVNDTHGHQAGDIVLRATAQVIKQSVREADIVIRFGGEEFLIVLLDVDGGETMLIAEKIRVHIEQLMVKLPEVIIQTTISLGVSEFPLDTDTLWSCINYADIALYRAKTEGRNRCVRFSREMWTNSDGVTGPRPGTAAPPPHSNQEMQS
ncbi:MAG: diguanylate cyclase [Desulfobulbus sp.]|nr:diguanylate cyclase [Desulfobulbus sp.]